LGRNPGGKARYAVRQPWQAHRSGGGERQDRSECRKPVGSGGKWWRLLNESTPITINAVGGTPAAVARLKVAVAPIQKRPPHTVAGVERQAKEKRLLQTSIADPDNRVVRIFDQDWTVVDINVRILAFVRDGVDVGAMADTHAGLDVALIGN
jgi:hypothetical protein